MAKILEDKEMASIIRRAIHGDEIDCQDAYEHFLEDLSTLITKHFGGEAGKPDFNEEIFTVAFHVDENVPADGGVYKNYDTDVTWKNGVETDSK